MFLQALNLFYVVRAIDEDVVIKLGVVRAVEFRTANPRRWRDALWRWRSLIINVKVFRATGFILALLSTTTMLSVDSMTIVVAFVDRISKVILVVLLAELMAVRRDADIFNFVLDNFRPRAGMVRINADGGTALVSLLPGNIDTVLCATIFQQLLLGVVVEEDIKVTFNLLGGRPIDLSVLLQTLDVGYVNLEDIPATLVASIESHRTTVTFHVAFPAHAHLELLLNLITMKICLEVRFVRSTALLMQSLPRKMRRLELCNCLCQPSTITVLRVRLAVAISGCATHFPLTPCGAQPFSTPLDAFFLCAAQEILADAFF